MIVLLGINSHLTRIRCVCEHHDHHLYTDRAKCHEPKQRFERSACAKTLSPDSRKVNSPRAQVKGDCPLYLESAISVATSSVSQRGDYFCGDERTRSFGR